MATALSNLAHALATLGVHTATPQLLHAALKRDSRATGGLWRCLHDCVLLHAAQFQTLRASALTAAWRAAPSLEAAAGAVRLQMGAIGYSHDPFFGRTTPASSANPAILLLALLWVVARSGALAAAGTRILRALGTAKLPPYSDAPWACALLPAEPALHAAEAKLQLGTLLCRASSDSDVSASLAQLQQLHGRLRRSLLALEADHSKLRGQAEALLRRCGASSGARRGRRSRLYDLLLASDAGAQEAHEEALQQWLQQAKAVVAARASEGKLWQLMERLQSALAGEAEEDEHDEEADGGMEDISAAEEDDEQLAATLADIVHKERSTSDLLHEHSGAWRAADEQWRALRRKLGSAGLLRQEAVIRSTAASVESRLPRLKQLYDSSLRQLKRRWDVDKPVAVTAAVSSEQLQREAQLARQRAAAALDSLQAMMADVAAKSGRELR
eukprot:PLAT868.1.p1 GENE.PLAT868.1~~PLAT868.1.p1  ORF type:complete len:451 (+),score=135.47 PLAT868.1:22-1353(+)